MKFNFALNAFLIGVLTILLTCYSYVAAANDTEELYESALIDLNNGDLDVAVIKIKNLLQESPENLPGRLLFAEMLLQYGELQAAEDQYIRAMSLQADRSLILVPLGRTLLLQGKYRELLESVTTYGNPEAIQAEIYLLRGQANLGIQEFFDAEFAFERALKLEPRAISAILGLAKVEAHRRNDEALQKLLARAKAIDPENTELWFFEGELNRQSGLFEKAIEAYDRAIEAAPNNHDARRSRAALYLDKNEMELADKDLSYILEKVPDDAYTLVIRAVWLAKSGESEEAKVILADLQGKLSVLDEQILSSFKPLELVNGVTEFLLKNYDEAERSLTQQLKVNPNNVAILEMLAEISFVQGDFKDVTELLNRIPKDKLNLRSTELFINALANLKKYFEALDVLNGINPDVLDMPQIQSMKAMILVRSGQMSQADSHMTALISDVNNNTESLLTLGYSYLERGQFQKAEELAEKLIGTQEPSVKLLNFIGAAYKSVKNFSLSEKYYRQALSIEPNDLLVQLNLSQLLLKNNKLEEANAIISSLFRNYPSDVRVIEQYAKLLVSKRDFEEAINQYNALLLQMPESEDIRFRLINLYLKLRNMPAALDVVDELVRMNGVSPAVLVAKAKIHIQMKQPEKAIRPLRLVLGLINNSPSKLSELVSLMLQAGDIEYAEQALADIKSVAPTNTQLPILEAQLLYAKGEVDKAIKKIEPINKLSPTFEYNELLAKYYSQINDLEKAIAYAEQAYSISKKKGLLPLLTSLYWKTENTDTATKLLENWLSDNRLDLGSRKVLANLYQQLNMYELSLTHYKAVLEENDEDLFSLVNTVKILTDKQLHEQAMRYAIRAYSIDAKDAEVNDTYGWLKVKLGDVQGALPLLRESYARDARSPSNLYHLGYVLHNQGRIEESKDMLRKSLTLSDDFTERQLVIELLETLGS